MSNNDSTAAASRDYDAELRFALSEFASGDITAVIRARRIMLARDGQRGVVETFAESERQVESELRRLAVDGE